MHRMNFFRCIQSLTWEIQLPKLLITSWPIVARKICSSCWGQALKKMVANGTKTKAKKGDKQTSQ